MTISSRTPEGTPNHCPVCDSEICLEPSLPAGDAPCPKCGTLLWFIVRPDDVRFYREDVATPTRETLHAFLMERFGQTLSAALPEDSLGVVELVMELEEEFDLEISDQDAEGMQNVDDLVEYLLRKNA